MGRNNSDNEDSDRVVTHMFPALICRIDFIARGLHTHMLSRAYLSVS